MLIPSISLSQYVPTENTHKDVTVKKEQSFSEAFNDGIKAGAAARTAAAAQAQARAAASAAMSDSSIETIVPLEVDLNNYEKVALVGITYANLSTGAKTSNKSTYNNFEQLFANSMLQVLNPYEVDKRKARKNNRFLREIKDPKTLYMYYETSLVGVNLHRMLIVRDFENKIIYRAKVVNIDKAELVAPFVYF